MTYQCIICGEGATEWTGSLFDCVGNRITLRHGQFESGITRECNDGAVVASSTGVMDTANGSRCYVSQLSFIANSDHNNKTVTCLHVSITNVTIIDSIPIILVTGKFMMNLFTYKRHVFDYIFIGRAISSP